VRPLHRSPFVLFAAAFHSLLCAGTLRSADPPAHAAVVVPPRATSDAGTAIHAPSPTCARPRPDVATRAELPRVILPAGLQRISVEGDAARLLADWETASRELEPVSRDERKRLLAVHHPGRSAHEIDLVCELRGPIDASALGRRYTWQPPVVSGSHVELTVEPVDPLERLFFRRFLVQLDSQTLRPVSIQFTDGAGAKSLPLALETSLSIEARLARAVRDPQSPAPLVLPASATRAR
jgi:hypothetical protein